jgi:predicted membrane chloride channel (bestrophin family)
MVTFTFYCLRIRFATAPVLGAFEDFGSPLQTGFAVLFVEAAVASAFCGIEAAAIELHVPLGNDPNDIDCAAVIEGICTDLQLIAEDCRELAKNVAMPTSITN